VSERLPGPGPSDVVFAVQKVMRLGSPQRARDAINAGAQSFTMYTVAEVVGHQKGDLGLSMTSRYARREAMEAKAVRVRAVKLPFPEQERPNDGPPHHPFAPSRRPGPQAPENRVQAAPDVAWNSKQGSVG
jgi:hypothetical protein